jgi:hypothetical protein
MKEDPKRVLWEIDLALEQILGIGRFDKVQPDMWVPCDNDEGGISIELPAIVAVLALIICRMTLCVKIVFSRVKKSVNKLRRKNNEV